VDKLPNTCKVVGPFKSWKAIHNLSLNDDKLKHVFVVSIDCQLHFDMPLWLIHTVMKLEKFLVEIGCWLTAIFDSK